MSPRKKAQHASRPKPKRTADPPSKRGAKANTSHPTVRFRTTLRQAEGMSATGVHIPAEVIEKLGQGKRPPVRVTINGYQYRTTVGVMSGQAMVGVSAAIRKETGLTAGDDIDVELAADDTPRDVNIPPDFAKALAAHPGVSEFFNELSNSLQRYHIDTINGAKTEDTRTRRIDKAVLLFKAGKKR